MATVASSTNEIVMLVHGVPSRDAGNSEEIYFNQLILCTSKSLPAAIVAAVKRLAAPLFLVPLISFILVESGRLYNALFRPTVLQGDQGLEFGRKP